MDGEQTSSVKIEQEMQPNLEQQVIAAREEITSFLSSMRYREVEDDWRTEKTRAIEDHELPELDQKIKLLTSGLALEDYQQNIVEDLRRLSDFQYMYGKSKTNGKVESMTLQTITDNLPALEAIVQGENPQLAYRTYELVIRVLENEHPQRKQFAEASIRKLMPYLKQGLQQTDISSDFDDRWVEKILSNGSADLAQDMQEMIVDAYKGSGNKYYRSACIGGLLASESDQARNVGVILATRLLEEDYGLDGRKLSDAWIDSSGETAKDRAGSMKSNFRNIDDLEAARPGISKFLYEEFGIVNFGRYPEEMLIRQFDERDNTEMPYGVILYPMADHNAAFQDEVLVFSEFSEEIKGKYATRIYEISNKRQLAESLIKANRKYGKATFGIVGGHGTEKSIQFGRGWISGSMYAADIFDFNNKDGSYSNEPKAAPKRLVEEFFIDNPTIILVSCSTGKGEDGGLANKISRLGARVIAPATNGSLGALDAQIMEDGKLELGARYHKANFRVFENGEERTSEYH